MIDGGSRKIYGSMMKSMDAGIGRVLKALERARLERDTLVIFTSDNGGERYSYNWPFSFQKVYLHEGGTRVPAIVRWPGVIPAGRVTEQAAITMDWTATILAVTGSDAGSRVSARRRKPDAGLHRRAARVRSHAVLADDRTGGGARRQLEIPRGCRRANICSTSPSIRGKKPTAAGSEPVRFERIKQQYLAWNAQMLPRPAKPLR